MLAQAGIREIVRGRLAPAYRRPRKSKRGLHGLVNNAGIYQPRTLMGTETELFERRTRVTQLGCFPGMKIVVPLMEQPGGGSIANISSVAGLRGCPAALAYSATKWALRG